MTDVGTEQLRPERPGRALEPLAGLALPQHEPPLEPPAEVVEPALPLAQRPGRVGQDAAAREIVQALAPAPHPLADPAVQPLAEAAEVRHQLGLLADDQLGGGRGRRGPEVGHEVGDRHVGLVADGGDHRDLRGGDRAGHRLLVEGPEVLERAAAAGEHEHVEAAQAVEVGQRLDDVGRRAVPLHPHGVDQHVDVGEAARDDAQEVPDGGARRRGDQPDPPGQHRERPLPTRLEQALGGQAALELVEGELESAQPRGSSTSHTSWYSPRAA